MIEAMTRKKRLILLLSFVLGTGVLFLFFSSFRSQSSDDADEIRITCGMVGLEFKSCKEGVDLWVKKTGHKAKVIPAPNGSNERLTLFQQHLAAESDNIDIYQVDVVWPGLLASHFEDLKDYIPSTTLDQYFPQLIANNTIKDRLVAMPWFVQVGFLYYRKDLLEKYHRSVPETWEELEETARFIQEKEVQEGRSIWGFVFQGKAYEGLTCNAIEWINSMEKGGTIVESDGHVSLYNEDALSIVNRIRSWIGVLVPEGVLNYEQEDCRGVFQSGRAIFMRNWPYAWPLLNAPDSPVVGKVGIMPLPKGGLRGKMTGVLGGWNLSLSKYSRHKKEAAQLIEFLTGFHELKRRSQMGGYFPPMAKLYKDPEVLASNPLMTTMRMVLENATLRPSRQTRSKYSQVSAAFWNAVHSALSGKMTTEKSFQAAEKKMNFLSKNGTHWL